VVGYLDYVTPNRLVGLAAAAETRLKHSVAEALRIKAREIRVNVPHCEETRFHLGLGVEGQVNGGGLVSPVTTALISNGSAVLASINGLRPLISLR
jgi:cation transport ATPase